MHNQELLTRPASKLTRKQRKERAALKREMAASFKLPRGYMFGQARISRNAGPLPPGTHVIIRDTPLSD